ncbi:MAG: 3-deoxy-D-manno-octulosonic acid transferase [Planctomycetes bacterium]|nr:3-deoxy-D-manno-octulosonic acid transferase [Planctomycetota bacterium]
MRWLANFVYLIGAVFYLPVLLYQMLVQGKNRRGWRERFGHWAIQPADKPRIWIHAVSLGEVNATPLLVRRLEEALAASGGCDVVISTTTDTGYASACRHYGPQRVFRFPLDFSWVVQRVLARVQPSLIVLVELEVWYNLVRTATRQGIPVAVVNGRLTSRSRKRLGWIGGPARAMFGDLAWVGAQDEPIARRFVEIGTPPDRVEAVGSVKWDTTTVSDTIEGADPLADALGLDGSPDAPGLWVCGSTGPGEETLILDAYQALRERGVALALAIVPRKPERFDEVAGLIVRRGFTCLRRSQQPDGSPAPRRSDASADCVILGDTMGELRKFYALARAVFVGRSLVPMGGSDPMEVAALAKAIIVGPHTDNFAAPVEALSRADAITTIATPAELADAVAGLLTDPDETRARGRRAREVVIAHQGATQRTVDRLVQLLVQR